MTFYNVYANNIPRHKLTQKIMSLLRHSITFSQHDPLDDGLKDAIRAEQREAESDNFENTLDGDSLAASWAHTLDDLKHDPDWFDFAVDD